MQFDEFGHIFDDLAGVGEGLETLAHQLRPDDVVVVEAHLAPGLETAGGSRSIDWSRTVSECS